MPKGNELEITGIVTDVPGGGRYVVKVDGEDERFLTCYLAGKMKMHRIGVLVGDIVRVIVPPPYDMGRIVYRGKEKR